LAILHISINDPVTSCAVWR